jgi:hypothetical protein
MAEGSQDLESIPFPRRTHGGAGTGLPFNLARNKGFETTRYKRYI